MISKRDGHIRVLPLHVANKIAAGEVVERPASVAKELVENAIDAGAKTIRISIAAGGRKLVAVQDDGSGMARDDALLSLERQATSKILDVDDIENIDTLGFRGEAIPSIASVSRFTITTRRHDSDEGTMIQVNAGTVAEVRSAGCPPGTLVEVRDLFCNVPARRKFLRAYATEEGHVRNVFTIHALAHPEIGFSLTVDGRELYRLAPARGISERIRDIFGAETAEALVAINGDGISGFIERPNLSTPTRKDQYVFVNGRPATAPSIAYAVREAYPRRQGDVRPALFLFVNIPPDEVDVNVHPTKREVRFRNNAKIREAVMDAIERALVPAKATAATSTVEPARPITSAPTVHPAEIAHLTAIPSTSVVKPTRPPLEPATIAPTPPPPPIAPSPIQTEAELPVAAEDTKARPWVWFRYLATTASGYLLIETDAGVVTINPHAARERIAYEQMLRGSKVAVQQLLIPETVHLSPTDSARLRASAKAVNGMGFQIEEFGQDTFKIDAIPQLIGEMSPSAVISTIVRDLAEGGARRGGERWREELIARSVARSFAGMSLSLTEDGAVKMVEELSATRMPYVCPRGKPIMIFTSNRELNRKFARE